MLRFWSTLSFLLLFVFSKSSASNIEEFDHTSLFSNAMSRTYTSLQDEDVLSKFKACCANSNTIDSKVTTELVNIVQNPVGFHTLKIISSRVYPYVECASSLEHLVNIIPCTSQTKSEFIAKARTVTSLCETLGVRNEKVSDVLKNIDAWLLKLKKQPVLFTDRYSFGSLLKVFRCSKQYDDPRKATNHIIKKINKYWNDSVRDVIMDFLPILKEGMFILSVGANSEYKYDPNAHYAEICLSYRGSPIAARCITGTLIYDRIDGEDVYACYSLSERGINSATGLHHEIFHHLAISLEMSEFPYFNRIVKVLKEKQIDGSYLLKLKEIYTDMDEFRNITGLFVDDIGNLYFDPCSEAAYLCAENRYIRGTHKSGTGTVKYIPISFVNFLKRSIRNLKLKSQQKQETIGELKWC